MQHVENIQYVYLLNKLKNAASEGQRCGTATKVVVKRQMVKITSD